MIIVHKHAVYWQEHGVNFLSFEYSLLRQLYETQKADKPTDDTYLYTDLLQVLCSK
jgi:hypothetical protein